MKLIATLTIGAAALATTVAIAQPSGLPDVITDYWSWSRLNIDRFTDNLTGAHPQPKDVYINLDPNDFRADGQTILPFPDGTVVVKERNDADELLVDRLYVMEKVAGAWAYSVYDREGTSAFSGRELGTDNFCSSCHEGVADEDYVFTRFETR